MLDSLFSLIAPHYCLSCGEIGRGLCECCKKNINCISPSRCVFCQHTLKNSCCTSSCSMKSVQQCILSRREGVLRQLLDDMKFRYAREHTTLCAELLHEPVLKLVRTPHIIVPIPSSSRHIRQRGFDHAKLIAKELARLCQLEYADLLNRNHTEAQVGSGRMQRFEQANTAFYTNTILDQNAPLLLLDDIVTTGATLRAAKVQLEKAGYNVAAIAAIAYQPLDETDVV